MPAPPFEGGVSEFRVHGLLRVHDGGYGLESDAEVNCFPIGNAALNAARAVGGGAHFAVLHSESIIVLSPGQQSPPKTGADLKAFGCRQAQHSFGEIGFQPAETRFAPARRRTP